MSGFRSNYSFQLIKSSLLIPDLLSLNSARIVRQGEVTFKILCITQIFNHMGFPDCVEQEEPTITKSTTLALKFSSVYEFISENCRTLTRYRYCKIGQFGLQNHELHFFPSVAQKILQKIDFIHYASHSAIHNHCDNYA